jgi:hypothetical protein
MCQVFKQQPICLNSILHNKLEQRVTEVSSETFKRVFVSNCREFSLMLDFIEIGEITYLIPVHYTRFVIWISLVFRLQS